MAFNLDRTLAELGITQTHIENCAIPLCEDCTNLVDAGQDMFGRPQQMTPQTLRAWGNLKSAAMEDNIELLLVSAYRSVEYQCHIIREKLDSGRPIDDILSVNAIPGHSEHHTGRALDLHAGDGEPLELAFEDHPAYHWLCDHAGEFGFQLSYPKDNPSGIAFEPWHWCFNG